MTEPIPEQYSNPAPPQQEDGPPAEVGPAEIDEELDAVLQKDDEES